MRGARLFFMAFVLAGGPALAADVPQAGLYRGFPVTYHVVNGQKVFQGDILLDKVAPLPGGRTHGGVTQGVGVAYAQSLWPKDAQGVAEIPYVVTSAAGQLNNALMQFNGTFAGVIQFVQRGSQTDYVNFDFDTNNTSTGPCESFVGRKGGPQIVSGPGGCTLGTLLHEMGHVVGLYHEMTRPDRDGYITIDNGNVIKGSEDNFAMQGDNSQNLGLFDYASVMMYIPFAFSRNGGPVLDSIPAGMQLSNYTGYTAGDIDSVKRLYGLPPTQVTVTSNPPGLTVSVDGNAVVTPHVYAWAMNSKHTLAVGTNAQTLTSGGSTYTYSYGRWSDSNAASHGITVKPGNNTLPQPRTSPAVTVYTANFVQLSPTASSVTPTGAGSITISPAPQSYAGASGVFLPARAPVSLTAAPTGAYKFVSWGGTSLPLSLNPKPDYVPDGGLPYTVSASFSTQPIFTIATGSPEFYFMIDNYYYFKGPQSFTADTFSGWGPGTSHMVTGFSPTEPYSVNTRFVFNSWSDGGALSHMFTVPSGASTLAGNFTAQYVAAAYAAPGCAATVTVSPTSPDGFYNGGTAVTVKAKPAKTGLKPTGWTGDLSGKPASQTLTVNDEEVATANYNITSAPFSLTALSPGFLVAGATGTVKIKGNGFASTSAVFVNNIYHASTYVSAKEIDVTLTGTDIPSAGALPIGVSNYPSSGSCGNYAAMAFLVANP